MSEWPTCVILELCGEAKVEGHVSCHDGADDQLPDFLHTMFDCGFLQLCHWLASWSTTPIIGSESVSVIPDGHDRRMHNKHV